MEVNEVSIHFEKDDNNVEFATIEVNSGIWFTNKNKLSNSDDKYKIYPKIDKDKIERSILYRASLCVGAIYRGVIEIDV